jgi:glycyl-tRNA synthetase alpha subunit
VVKPPVDEDIVFNVTYYLKVVGYDIHPIKGNIPYSLNHIPISLVHMLITGV